MSSCLRTASNSSNLTVSVFSWGETLGVAHGLEQPNQFNPRQRSFPRRFPSARVGQIERGDRIILHQMPLDGVVEIRRVQRNTSLAMVGSATADDGLQHGVHMQRLDRIHRQAADVGLMSRSMRLRTMLGCFQRPRIIRSK